MYSGGTGTELDPYLIANAEDLNNVRYNLSAHFKQIDNINLCKYSNWIPIGQDTYDVFMGSYDGGNFNITNLKLKDSTGYWTQGLFAGVDTEYWIKNVNIINADVICYGDSGILAGDIWKGDIINCHVSGKIKINGYGCVGGIAGLFWVDKTSKILNSSSIIEVIFDDPTSYNTEVYEVGGIAGGIGSNKANPEPIIIGIENCFSIFKFSHLYKNENKSYDIGGLVGSAFVHADSLNKVDIKESYCYSIIEDVTSRTYSYTNIAGSGAFIGNVRGKVDISDSFCYGTCKGDSSSGIGGFVGIVDLYGYMTYYQGVINITNCYSYAQLIDKVEGAFVGTISKHPTDDSGIFNITNCYYDSQISGASDLYATSKTTAELKQQFTFTNYDFANIWGIDGIFNDGYPFLRNTDILIYTPQQLNNVRNYLSCSYRQMADIDLSIYVDWEPIGNDYAPFTGSFDGQGFNINNMTICTTGIDAGLFQYGDNCILKNIKLTNISINTDFDGAGLIVHLTNGTVINCAVTGVIVTGDNGSMCGTGGLIGELYGGNVTNSNFIGSINSYYLCGGLIAYIYGQPAETKIEKCFTSCTLNASFASFVSGLIPSTDCNNGDIEIINCYSVCNIASDETANISLLIGEVYGSTHSTSDTRIINCYGSGTLYGGIMSGLISANHMRGTGDLIVINCYYNSETSGQSDNDGRGIPKTTAEMKTQSTFVGWDFTTPIWAIDGSTNDGYPFFYEVICGGELNVYVITNEGVKQAVKMCIITDEGLKEVKKLNVITNEGLK